jgi:hypothetical protein
MRFFLDDVLVGLVLLASVAYAMSSLGPKSLRGRLLLGASAVLRRLPGLHELAQRLQTAASTKAKGACGGCDNCGSDQPPTVPLSEPEVRIPVSTIGKR